MLGTGTAVTGATVVTVRPYHVPVPSFGEWGFALATPADTLPIPDRLTLPRDAELRYLTDALLPTLFVFPPDLDRVPTEVNRLDNQRLVQYYERPAVGFE